MNIKTIFSLIVVVAVAVLFNGVFQETRDTLSTSVSPASQLAQVAGPALSTSLTGPDAGGVSTNLTFTATVNYTGVLAGVKWNFGTSPYYAVQTGVDSTDYTDLTYLNLNRSASYSNAGTYTVTFVAWTSDGRYSTTTKSITIASGSAVPTVTLSASPSMVNEGGAATLTWSSTNSTSCSASWTSSTATSGSQSVNPQGYSTYSITCTGAGGSATKSTSIDVQVNQPPTVSANTGAAYSVTQGTALTFRGSATDSDGTIASTLWNFGDGTTASGTLTPSHTYATAGSYTATLTATDSGGMSKSSQATVTVSSKAPSVSLDVAPYSISAGSSALLTWSSANTTSCSASWTSSTATSGSQSVSPSDSTSYSITCTGPNGSVSASTYVSIAVASSGCTGTGSDTKSPTASFVYPTGTNPILSGTVQLKASVMDNKCLSKAEFYVGDTAWTLIGSKSLSGSSAEFTYDFNTTSKANGMYSLLVLIYDAAGNKGQATYNTGYNNVQILNTSTGDTTAPSTPGSLVATAVSASQVNLSWNASTDNVGVTGYKVYRGSTLVTTVAGTTYSDVGLSANTTYNYSVKATDAAGNLSNAIAATATTNPNPSTTFSAGDRINVTGVVNVRGTPTTSGTLLGTQPSGALGTIVSGGTYANGYFWWNVNYDSGVDGWTVENYLARYTPPANQPPTVSANTGAAYSVTQGTALTFRGSATDSDGTIASTLWNFGDGTTASGTLTPSHTYATAGSYTATLTATDNIGASAVASAPVSVQAVTSSCSTGTGAPTPSITSPSNGSTISGVTTLVVTAGSGRCLYSVDLYVSNNGAYILATSTQVGGTASSVAIAFDTNTVTNNTTHTFIARAYDSTRSAYNQVVTSLNVANVSLDPGITAYFKEITRQTSTSGEGIGKSIKTDSAGNIIVVGTFKGTTAISGTTVTSLGNSDVYLAKYDPSGTLLWMKTFGGTSDDVVYAMTVDSNNNIYLAGGFFGTTNFGGADITSGAGIYGSDIFVAKYTSSGTHVWSKGFGGSYGNNEADALAVDATGNLFVAGKVYQQFNIGAGTQSALGSSDGFLVKLYGSTGGYIWSETFGGSGSDYATGVSVDSNGNPVVVGYGYGNIDMGAGSVTNKGSADLFIAKYAAADGGYLWSKVVGNTGPDIANGVAVDASNNIVVTGSFNSAIAFDGQSLTAPIGSAIFVTKYGSSGAIQWAKSFGYDTSGGTIGVRGIAVDASGNIIVSGNATGGVDFGAGSGTYGDANIYIAKYNPQGRYLWAKRSTNTGISGGYAVAVDMNRNIYNTGFIQGDVTFDAMATVSTPSTQTKSSYLIKVSP